MRKIRKPSKYFMFLLAMWAVVIFNSDFMGKVEGYFFPVVGNFHFVEIEKKTDYTTVSGSFDKYRSCAYDKIEWYLYDVEEDHLAYRVYVSFNSDFQIRKRGHHEFTEWRVYNNGYDLSLSNIYLVHRCHSLWNTVTQVK